MAIRYLQRAIPAGSRADLIGCSDIGSIFGVNPWSTEFDLYRKFCGEEQVLDEKTAKRMWLGHKAEEGLVAPYVSEDFGVELIQPVDENGVELAWYREDMPYFICHPDRLIKGSFKDVERVGLEIKTVSANSRGWGDEWTDDIPAQYLLQCTGYVACGVCDAVLLAAYRDMAVYYYWIQPSEELVRAVINSVRDWYERAVSDDYRPAPANFREAIELFNPDTDSILTANEKQILLVKEMRDLQAQIKELEEKVDGIKTSLIQEMDGYKSMVDENGQKLCSVIISNRKTFNKDKAIEAHPDLMGDEFYKFSETRTLR